MFGWRRKLALEACAAQGAAGGFVEARVLGEGGGVGCGGGVMIDLAGGRRVTVARGFDPRLLLEVIGALESTEPSLAVTGQRRRERRAPGAPS